MSMAVNDSAACSAVAPGRYGTPPWVMAHNVTPESVRDAKGFPACKLRLNWSTRRSSASYPSCFTSAVNRPVDKMIKAFNIMLPQIPRQTAK
jgi:hypothetical protein